MAGSSLLALIDDISLLLDDVAVLTKVAAKKTAGVLGDDLALNAQQVAGVASDRELPVVWAVAKGSAFNKLILVPAAMAISALEGFLATQFGVQLPIILTLMMIGGLFLCYEGMEKISHKLFHSGEEDAAEHRAMLAAAAQSAEQLLAFERNKIRGAIRTDFILSAEIIVLSLGATATAGASFATQTGVLIAISILMTVGVYGLVAGIVKIDDAGVHLSRRTGVARQLGRFLLWMAPYLMKTLSVVGTAAMFLVGGGIFTHNVATLHHLWADWTLAAAAALPVMAGAVTLLLPILLDLLFGMLAGTLTLWVVLLMARLWRGGKAAPVVH